MTVLNGAPPPEYVELLGKLLDVLKNADGAPLNAPLVKGLTQALSGMGDVGAALFAESLKGAPAGIAIESTFWRAVHARYQSVPLGTDGSKNSAGRFHRVPDPTLYLSQNSATVQEELNVRSSRRPHTTVAVKVALKNVLDLTSEEFCSKNKIPMSALSAEWEFQNDILGIEAYTQKLAKVARSLMYEGLLVESARHKGHSNLVVFHDMLKHGSYLEVIDEKKDLEGIVHARDMRYDGFL